MQKLVIKIPQEFARDRFVYTQVLRKGRWAIYRQHWKHSKDASHDAYEVVRIDRADKTFVSGSGWIACEPREIYPGSETWGLKGSSFASLESAKNALCRVVVRG